MNSAYDRLAARFARIATIGEANVDARLGRRRVMPPGGARGERRPARGAGRAAHGLLTAPEVGDELAEAEADGESDDPWRAANLRLMRHAHTRATALPPDLVEAQARANSACEKVWREARRDSRFRPGPPASGGGGAPDPRRPPPRWRRRSA